MRVVAVSAHADDETLGCGGTLLKHQANGDEINWILASSPQADSFDEEFIARRRNQIDEAARAYGMTNVETLGLPAAGLDMVSSSDLIGRIATALEKISPDRIYVVHRGDVHSDHRVVADAVWAASKPFNTGVARDIYAYETMSSTNLASPTGSDPFVATAYSDIGDYLERKLEILKIFDTEIHPYPHPRSLEAVEAAARFRGSSIGIACAEAFMVVRASW